MQTLVWITVAGVLMYLWWQADWNPHRHWYSSSWSHHHQTPQTHPSGPLQPTDTEEFNFTMQMQRYALGARDTFSWCTCNMMQRQGPSASTLRTHVEHSASITGLQTNAISEHRSVPNGITPTFWTKSASFIIYEYESCQATLSMQACDLNHKHRLTCTLLTLFVSCGSCRQIYQLKRETLYKRTGLVKPNQK